MELVGGADENVTNHPAYDGNPVWSPDGGRLAFMSTRGFELGTIGPFPGHLYVTDLADGALRMLTRTPLTSSLGPSDWSADGASVLMARVVDGRPTVFVLDVEGGAERRLTHGDAGEYSAVFSHAGDRIAFHSDSGDESQIVVADLRGGTREALTSGPGLRYNPRWSPDDRWILFSASEDGRQYDVKAVRLENGFVLDLVATPEDEREGEWLPPPR